MFTRKEDDDTLTRLIVYIDDCMYFSTSDTAKEVPKQLVDRFNVELQRLTHWYLAARIHQDKDFNVTMDQSRYAKSTVTRFLEALSGRDI
jgi:hypothetical protein